MYAKWLGIWVALLAITGSCSNSKDRAAKKPAEDLCAVLSRRILGCLDKQHTGDREEIETALHAKCRAYVDLRRNAAGCLKMENDEASFRCVNEAFNNELPGGDAATRAATVKALRAALQSGHPLSACSKITGCKEMMACLEESSRAWPDARLGNYLRKTFGRANDALAGRTETSGIPVDYGKYRATGYRTQSFGFGPSDKMHRDKVEFRYMKPASKVRVTLEYAAWGIDDSEEVVITVNGARVGTVPRTPKTRQNSRDGYEYGLRLDIAPHHMRKGANEIVFHNTRNSGGGSDGWEISFVRLKGMPISPSDVNKAKACFSNGKLLYEERKANPANLLRAIRNYECARDALEELPRKPPEYAVSFRQIDVINKEISRLFRNAVPDARRESRASNVKEARRILENAVQMLASDPDDSRYIHAQQVLKELHL